MKKQQDKNGQYFCKLPKTRRRIFSDNVSPLRERLIMISHKKWVNGTQLKYYFFDQDTDGEYIRFNDGTTEWRTWQGTENQKNVVREAFNTWKSIGIGLDFTEVADREDAEIRIGFMADDGSWSYVGRDILRQGSNDRTMNFGWDISNEIDTALHEIGHTLGFPHEHQNPKSGIEWNKEAVYASLGGYPNYWSREDVDRNILSTIDADIIQGSNWDANSIMHYPFSAGLINLPEEFRQGLNPSPGLSAVDIERVRFFYPALGEKDFEELELAKSVPIEIRNGEQKNFIFKPKNTREYQIETFGGMDAVMVLFQRNKNGELIYLSGDDDSGEEKQASIAYKLLKDNEYVISLRQFYNAGGVSPIMIH